MCATLIWLLSLCSTAYAAGVGGWPDLSTPRRTSQHAPEDAALVISVEHYSALPDVPFADRDADAFASWAIFSAGIPPSRVHRLQAADSDQIKRVLQTTLTQVGPRGTLWIYFAGHGVINVDGGGAEVLTLGFGFDDVSDDDDDDDDDPLIAARAKDARGEHLLLGAGDTPESHALSVEQIQRLLDADDSGHAILIVDAGFSGIGRDGTFMDAGVITDVPPPPTPRRDTVVTWLAASPGERASALDEARMGLFSWHVLAALRGWADGVLSPPDGHVTLEEAQIWTRRRIESLERPQHPTLDPRVTARAWRLTTAAEASPDLSELKVAPLTEPTPVELDAIDTGDLVWEAEPTASPNTTDDQAPPTIAETFAEAEADLRRQFSEKAAVSWARAYTAALSGSPHAITALRLFIDTFGDVTFFVAGRALHLSAPEISLARRMLAHGGKLTEPLLPEITLPAGQVMLGLPADSPNASASNLLTPVSIPHRLAVASTEVSQANFKGVTGYNPSSTKGPSLPVTNVTWYQAIAFCNALSRIDGFEPAYQITNRHVQRIPEAYGWRLPTEAEWVLIQQDTTATMQETSVCAYANLAGQETPQGKVACDDGSDGLAPTGTKLPTPSGVYDIIGNVWEWTSDAFAPLSGQPQVNPQPSKGNTRIIKGGSFRTSLQKAATTHREAIDPETMRDDLGFRVVRTLPNTASLPDKSSK